MAAPRTASFPAPRTALLRAPAKVNLCLRIVGRRPDGYHDLDTTMVAVSLYDSVELEVRRRRGASRVTCRVTGPEKVEGGGSNLAARAATAVLEALGETAHVGIRLRKVVPFGAGLGGGSSDAAAVIRGLPPLLGRRLAPAVALRIAAGLGADVPFFLAGRPSRATGIGDVLTPLARPGLPPKGTLVLVVPRERVNTAWAYRHALPRLTSSRSASRVPALRKSARRKEPLFFNDFQAGVEKALPNVGRIRRRLEQLGAEAACLTGSGSAVFGIFPRRADADRAAASFGGEGEQVFVARFLMRVPRAQGTGRKRRAMGGRQAR